jgi:hypothetical protein
MKSDVSVSRSASQGPGLNVRHSARLFEAILQSYIKAKLTSPLSAIDYDPDSRPFKWVPALAEYVADVQSATERVLRDSPAEQGIWHQLSLHVAKDLGIPGLPEPRTIPLKDADAVIQKCARIYFARNLEPKEYFTRIKRRAEDRP